MGLSCARAAGPATNAQKQHRPITTASAPAHLFHICMEYFLPLTWPGVGSYKRQALSSPLPDIDPEFPPWSAKSGSMLHPWNSRLRHNFLGIPASREL